MTLTLTCEGRDDGAVPVEGDEGHGDNGYGSEEGAAEAVDLGRGWPWNKGHREKYSKL